MNAIRRIRWPRLWSRDGDYDRRADIDFKDAWVEGDHPRVPAGGPEGGEFVSGGGGTSISSGLPSGGFSTWKAGLPKPPSYVKSFGEKIAAAIAAHQGQPHEVAEEIKKIAQSGAHNPNNVSYTNKVLKWLGTESGKMLGSVSVQKGVPAKAPAMPPPPPFKPPPSMAPAGPAKADIEHEKLSWVLDHPSMTPAEKVAWVNAIMPDIPASATETLQYAKGLLKMYGGAATPEAKAEQQQAAVEQQAAMAEGPPLPSHIPLPQKSAVLQIQKIGNDLFMSPEDKISAIYGPAAPFSAGSTVHEYAKAWENHIIENSAPSEIEEQPPPPPPANLPAPKPGSNTQEQMHAVATATATAEQKAAMIKGILAGSGGSPGGAAETYANQLLTALEQSPTTVTQAKESMAASAGAAAPKTAEAKAVAAKTGPRPNVFGAAAQQPSNITTARQDSFLNKQAFEMENNAKKPDGTNTDEAKQIAPSLNKSFWKDVSKTTNNAISYYGGSGYDEMNPMLRGNQVMPPEMQEFVNAIDEQFYREETKLTDDVIIRRGENTPVADIAKWRKALAEGTNCFNARSGYTSASMANIPAFSQKKVWWHFTVPKGHRVLGIAGAVGNHENEVLLPHGQQTQIMEIWEAGGKTHIKAICR